MTDPLIVAWRAFSDRFMEPAARNDPHGTPIRDAFAAGWDAALAALSTPPPSLDIDRLARAIRIVTERPVTLGHEADTEMDEADWLANAYAREYARSDE